MHKLRIMPLSLMALTIISCSSSLQDDPIAPEPNPQPQLVGISFRGNNDTWQDAPTTRAGKTGLETIFPSFRVWGYKTTDENLTSSQLVMDGYTVKYEQGTSGSTTSNTNNWEYVGITNTANTQTFTQTIKYWDYAATSYRFFAYSPSDAQITVSASTSTENEGTESATTTNKTFTYPFAYSETATNKDFPYISELWFAKDKDNYGKSVMLTFAPIVAKLRFRFTYPEGTTKISIKDIQFQDSRENKDTPLKGNISAAYPLAGTPASSTPTFTWTTSTETGSTGSLIFTTPYEDKDTPLHILEDESEYGKWYYVPPLGISQYTQGSYTITARIDGNHSTATVPAEFMQWKPGYQYTYTFKITEAGTQITFADLQVEQWQTAPNTDNNGTGTAGW